jgi:transcriptional regulator with XRE-family HTH domain
MRMCAIIETAAEAQGMTVRELLRGFGVHQSNFDRWRKGENAPSLRVLERFDSGGIPMM